MREEFGKILTHETDRLITAIPPSMIILINLIWGECCESNIPSYELMCRYMTAMSAFEQLASVYIGKLTRLLYLAWRTLASEQ